MTSRLQAELKQTRPFGSLRQEAILQLARSAAVLTHRWEQYLRPYGITSTQYNVLRILRGAGKQGLDRRRVACRLLTPVPDVSRLLDRMMHAGLLTRARGTVDRRTVHSCITPKGLCILDQLDALSLSVPEAQMGHLSDDEVRQLIALLEVVRQNDAAPGSDCEESASQ